MLGERLTRKNNWLCRMVQMSTPWSQARQVLFGAQTQLESMIGEEEFLYSCTGVRKGSSWVPCAEVGDATVDW